MSMNYFLNLYIINHSLLCDGLGPIQPPASLTLPAAHSIGVQLGGWGRPLLAPPLPTPRWDVGKIEVRMLRLPLQSKSIAVFFLQVGPIRVGPSANPLADSDVTLHTQPMTWIFFHRS